MGNRSRNKLQYKVRNNFATFSSWTTRMRNWAPNFRFARCFIKWLNFDERTSTISFYDVQSNIRSGLGGFVSRNKTVKKNEFAFKPRKNIPSIRAKLWRTSLPKRFNLFGERERKFLGASKKKKIGESFRATERFSEQHNLKHQQSQENFAFLAGKLSFCPAGMARSISVKVGTVCATCSQIFWDYRTVEICNFLSFIKVFQKFLNRKCSWISIFHGLKLKKKLFHRVNF